MSHETSLSG